MRATPPSAGGGGGQPEQQPEHGPRVRDHRAGLAAGLALGRWRQTEGVFRSTIAAISMGPLNGPGADYHRGLRGTLRRSGVGGGTPLWPPMGEGENGEGGGLRLAAQRRTAGGAAPLCTP